MYGLVNRAIKEMVTDAHGDEVWNEIATAAGVDPIGFVALENYDDDITYNLIESASEKLQSDPETILQAFGKYWVLYVGSDDWGYLFDIAGNDFINFLRGLNNLHARVESAMPESRTPQFNLCTNGDHFTLEYHSHRDGLAPMILGLLDGLMQHFGEHWKVEHAGSRFEQGFDSFTLTQAG